MMSSKIVCPVCGKTEFQEKCDYDICEYCGWENEDYFEAGGANWLSLAEYKKRYQIYIYLNPGYTWKACGEPELTKKELCAYWHQYSVSNKQTVLSSEKCGCFFCNQIFDSNLITDFYIQDEKGETAICPFCGVDSILPDSKVELSAQVLEDMHKLWFD